VLDNAKLLLVGDGQLKDRLIDVAKSLKIDDKVIFTGNRNDVNDILQASDVFCLPSRFEGLGIVLIEAQSAGLKCLASDVIPKEVCVTDNITMLPNKVENWVEQIIEISKGYERRNMYEEITNAGYNIKEQIKKVEKLYSNF
jgi:glycosyltransferase involved in cell wall biosynthesis